MNYEESELVSILIGQRTKRISEMEQEGVVPPYLAAKYSKEAAAREAANLPTLSTALLAGLLIASFTDEEEDVRAAARHTLIMHGGSVGDAVHFALTMDDDPYVRETALDEALDIDDSTRRANLIRQAVEALAEDKTEFVRRRAQTF